MICDNLIDIHSHILPDVDDGSDNMEETIKMLHIAWNQGIKSIIATPHFACGVTKKTADQLFYIMDQVQEEAYKIDMNFKIYLGNELYYSESIIEALKSKKALTLADSRYVLVEFSLNETYKNIYQAFKNLTLAGYAPILAHVERYICLKKNGDYIRELIELGAYMQMNSASLQGSIFDFGAAYNRKILWNGIIHLIGTDCHDDKLRAPVIQNAVKIIGKKSDFIIEQILRTNPLKILENKYI